MGAEHMVSDIAHGWLCMTFGGRRWRRPSACVNVWAPLMDQPCRVAPAVLALQANKGKSAKKNEKKKEKKAEEPVQAATQKLKALR